MVSPFGIGSKQKVSTGGIGQSLYRDLYVYNAVSGEGQVLRYEAEERRVIGIWLSLSRQQEQEL